MKNKRPRDDLPQEGGESEGDQIAKKANAAATAATTATLVDDVIPEILLRLPAKSTIRFRSVCKSWRGAVDEPSFARAHVGLRIRGSRSDILRREGLWKLGLHLHLTRFNGDAF